MKKKELIVVGIILIFILVLFFNKFFLYGYIPFPGDLLIHDYSPYKYYSYLGYNPGSYPSKLQYFDVIRQLYPWKVFVIDQFKNGQIPLWNPYNFAGAPLLANFQSQVFSPFNLPYFIFPYVYAWTLGLSLQIILAFIFTFIYTRYLNFSTKASVLSSIAFSCSLFMSVFFEYGVFGQTILWLPLILFGVEKILTQFSLRSLLILVGSITFSAFGGHLQVFAYTLFFSIIYAAARLFAIKKKRVVKFGWLSFSLFSALGLSAIQFSTSVELIKLSARASYDMTIFIDRFLLKINELILFIAPDFYGNPTTNNYLLNKSYPETALYIGIVPLIFALSVLFIKKENPIKFYMGAVIISLLAITNNPISKLLYSLQLPFISSSSPTNGIFIISFSLSILAGFGFDQWMVKKNRSPLFVASILLMILLLIFSYYKIAHGIFSSKNVILSIIILSFAFTFLLITKITKNVKAVALILIIFTVFDLFYFFQKFNPFVPKEIIFPEAAVTQYLQQEVGINRVWGYGNANIAANTNLINHFQSPEGYDPLYPRRYGEFIYAAEKGKLPDSFSTSTRSDAAINNSLGFVPGNKFATKVLNTLGVKYFVDRVENGSTEKTFPADNFESVYSQTGWKVYKNKAAAKRIFLSSDYQLYNSKKEFEKLFFVDSFNPAKTILIENNPGFKSIPNDEIGDNININKYTANEISLQVNSSSKKLLFLSDLYYPGWKALIDGQEVSILRADYTFRAIVLPHGDHKVEFIYRPASFDLGIKIAIISVIILLVVSMIVYMRKLNYED